VRQGFDKVCESVAYVHVVDNAGTESIYGTREQSEGDGDIFFGCAKGKSLQQDDGDGYDAEECAHWRVTKVVPWV
jgi:hypothetical protein